MRADEILAGVDDSGAGQRAADWAAYRAEQLGLRLNLVRAVPGPSNYRKPSQYREAMEKAQGLLESEQTRLASLVPSLTIITTRRTGEAATVLRLLSDAAETVALGTDRPPDFRGEGFGSISFQSALLCRSPVAIIPIRQGEGRGVVVGIDGSDDSAIALKLAGDEAVRASEDLTVLYAVPRTHPFDTSSSPAGSARVGLQDAQGLLSAVAATVQALHPGLLVHKALESDDSPADALTRAAENARLLVIGCRGRGGLRKPMGAVAAQVLLNLSCPTIITRPASANSGSRPPRSQSE